MSEKQNKRWEKLQNAAHRLNRDAYHYCARHKIPYNPCPKAQLIINEAKEGKRALVQVAQEAALESCGCHPNTSWQDIHDMMFDAEARLENMGEEV